MDSVREVVNCCAVTVSGREAELRIYVVLPGRMEAFVQEWRDAVLPLRERFGFCVVGAWVDD